jgi:hypothetical protein
MPRIFLDPTIPSGRLSHLHHVPIIIEYESDACPPLVRVEKTLKVMRRWGKC